MQTAKYVSELKNHSYLFNSIFIPLGIIFSLEIYGQNVTSQTISVEPYLTVQNYEHFRRFVLNTGNPEIDFIEGFEFEWGFTYQLKINVTHLQSELSDGTRYTCALEKVISKTPIADTTEFTLFIHPDRYYYQLPPEEEDMNGTLKVLNDSTYVYLEEVEIEVPKNLRDQFLVVANGDTGKSGKFRFVNGKRIRFLGW